MELHLENSKIHSQKELGFATSYLQFFWEKLEIDYLDMCNKNINQDIPFLIINMHR